jgi:hypothetical protein
MTTREQLQEIVDWLNENYNQQTENYNVFTGSKPGVIKYNDHVAISPWACGAIICINSLLYFIEEDDGNWYLPEGEDGECGCQTCFSIGWTNSFITAITELKKYVDEHGTPVYFSGTNVICNYTLGSKE